MSNPNTARQFQLHPFGFQLNQVASQQKRNLRQISIPVACSVKRNFVSDDTESMKPPQATVVRHDECLT